MSALTETQPGGWQVIDLTHRFGSGIPAFPGDPEPVVVPWARLEVHGFASEAMFAGTHNGTHVDAPGHFIAGGASVDAVPLSRLVAPVCLLDLRGVQIVDAGALRAAEARTRAALGTGQAALLWTGWSRRWRTRDYLTSSPGCTRDGAEYLVQRRVHLVGIDAPSVDLPGANGFPAHHALLEAGVPIVENLCGLAALRGRNAIFVAAPLPIVGASGAPARALALVPRALSQGGG